MKLTEAQAWAAIGDMLYAEAEMPFFQSNLCPPYASGLCEAINLPLNDGVIDLETSRQMRERIKAAKPGDWAWIFNAFEWEPRAMLCWLWEEVAENE